MNLIIFSFVQKIKCLNQRYLWTSVVQKQGIGDKNKVWVMKSSPVAHKSLVLLKHCWSFSTHKWTLQWVHLILVSCRSWEHVSFYLPLFMLQTTHSSLLVTYTGKWPNSGFRWSLLAERRLPACFRPRYVLISCSASLSKLQEISLVPTPQSMFHGLGMTL